MEIHKKSLKKLADLITENVKIKFIIANIGCRPNDDGTPDLFEMVLEYFPYSEIIGFELDKEICEKLNKEPKKGFKFFNQALGRKKERRKLYNTMSSMCSSLYKPNKKFLEKYNALDSMYLKNISEIDTISLDEFCFENQIGKIDFIKIDIQGAELDVFKGGTKILKDTLCIVSEVEFVPFYINQPLFGDVFNFLNKQGFTLTKFLGFGGRYIKPFLINNAVSGALNQQLWADVFFIKNIESIKLLEDEKLLKLSFLAFLHYSPDLAILFLSEYDLRHSTTLHKKFMTNNFL